jgi:hypothetical protein
VNPRDFFNVQSDGIWGGDRQVFDAELINEIAAGPIAVGDDVNTAQALTRLVYEELKIFSVTSSEPRLNDIELANAIRALRAVLGRLEIAFDPAKSSSTGVLLARR